MDGSKIFIVGANGQLGTALQEQYPEAQKADAKELDITDRERVMSYDWSNIDTIVNAAAYTNVDEAETDEGRKAAWAVNDTAVGNLCEAAREHNCTLVHISTDYVFDGTKQPHTEDEPFSPLGVYGASKAAGDKRVTQLEKFFLVRTSWVIGEGKNFVRIMLGLGEKGIDPQVVDDQTGRLTFTTELVRAIDHLLSNEAPFGIYNVSNGGPVVSWADVARKIFEEAGLSNSVNPVTTEEYFKSKPGVAPRPLKSELALDKIIATGFEPHDWQDDLSVYIKKELS